MSTDSNKFSRDVIWNISSLAVSGACGIILTYLIGLVYDEATLGIFNQVFAVYLLFSQIAVLGVHHSALQGVASASHLLEKRQIATSALIAAGILGFLASVAFLICSPTVANLLSSPEVGTGMVYAAPGLVFFALDKVLIACANAERRMGWYAILTGSRFVFMLLGLGICIYLECDRATLPAVLAGAEFVTFGLSVWATRDLLRPIALGKFVERARAHIAFGIRGFMSGVLAGLHSRVDVLMLGYFTTDTAVGIYSFAAILAEGMFQVLVVLKANYAPLCVRLLATNQLSELGATIRRARNRVYLASIPIAVLASAIYAYVLPGLIPSPMVTASAPYFAILLAGMALSAGYMPFFHLLLQGNRPGSQTWLILATVLVNIACNAILIPFWGATGAALGTAAAHVASAGLLILASRRLLSLRI